MWSTASGWCSGTLSVLRSNALGTGATALRAVGGTAVGFLVGSAIMVGVANHTVLLWVLLPLSVLVAGVVPSVISFAAGQAGFTLVVIILFNIIDPVGWKVGLTRIEDVAIGCGVSIVVGLLFWPRGATAALGRALSDSFVASSGYLSHAVDRLTTAEPRDRHPAQPAGLTPGLHAARRRLPPVPGRAGGQTGVGGDGGQPVHRVQPHPPGRLHHGHPPPSDAEPARAGVGGGGPGGAAGLLRHEPPLVRGLRRGPERQAGRLDPPPVHDQVLDDVLLKAFDDVREHRRGDRLRTSLQMLWADELLEQQGQIQADLAASATLFARPRHRMRTP